MGLEPAHARGAGRNFHAEDGLVLDTLEVVEVAAGGDALEAGAEDLVVIAPATTGFLLEALRKVAGAG